MAIRGFIKNPRALKLNRVESLTRGLIFAYSAGASLGFETAGNTDGGHDMITKVRGTWDVLPHHANYEDTSPIGRIVGSRVSAPGAEVLTFAPPVGMSTIWDISWGMSVYSIFSPDQVGEGSPRSIICKRNGNLLADVGWDLHLNSGDTFSFEFSNGTNETQISSSELAVEHQTYCLIATYDRATVKLFLDGKLVASAAATHTVGNNSFDLAFFKKLPISGRFECAGAAIWNRALDDAEVHQMNSDPFRMFRWYAKRQDFDIAAFGGGTNFFLSF